jgi:hypothetical protein
MVTFLATIALNMACAVFFHSTENRCKMYGKLVVTILLGAAVVASRGCESGNSGEGGSSGNSAPGGCGTVSLAAHTSPAASSANVVANRTRPPYSGDDSAIQTCCANSGIVSNIVVVAPDMVAPRSGASVKSQELAADPKKQTVAAIRTTPNMPATATTFNGENPIDLCMDTAPGRSDNETRTSLNGEIGPCIGPVMRLMFVNAPAFDAQSPGASSHSAPSGISYYDLFQHGSTCVAQFGLSEPFTRPETSLQEGMARTISQPPMPGNAPVLADLDRSRPFGAAHRPFTKDNLIRNFSNIPDVSGGADCSAAGSPGNLVFPPEAT